MAYTYVVAGGGFFAGFDLCSDGSCLALEISYMTTSVKVVVKVSSTRKKVGMITKERTRSLDGQ